MARTLAELARRVEGRVVGDAARTVEAVRTVAGAGPRDLSFVTHPRYREAALASAAGALLVGEDWEGGSSHDLLVCPEPYWALAQILGELHGAEAPPPTIHPTAVIAEDCELGAEVAVGPQAVIGAGSHLGDRVRVGAGSIVGARCRLGEDSLLHAGVILYDGVVLGRRCILHSGCVLGADGFGFAQHQGRHVKIPHLGEVVLGDDVEVGANSSIDRAMLDDTRIGDGVKIDNLVQIGHNVVVGDHSLLIAQSGVAGSARLGRGVVLAGQVGVAGHIEIGDGVQAAAGSRLFKEVATGTQVAGYPARPIAQWRREMAVSARLGEVWNRLRRLEKRRDPSGDAAAETAEGENR